MPRVLFVHHRPQASGAARSLALLAGALDDRWDRHAVVPEGAAATALRAAGVTVHPSPVPAFTHTWDVQYHGMRWLVLGRELAALPPHLRELRRVIRTLRPDLVHINDSVMLASGALAAHERTPVVWHLRSSLPDGGLDRRSRFVCQQLDRTTSAAIAIDDDVALSFHLRTPVHVIGNPVLLESGPVAALGVPPGTVTLGWFGFLRRQKGWPELLHATRMLLDDALPVHTVFVGGAIRPSEAYRGIRGRLLRVAGVPDEDGDFRRLVHQLGLERHVTLVPHVGDPASYLRAVDIVVFPNQGAGLGRPVLEGAAAGKAVVASGSRAGGGVLLPGETGILVEGGSPATLAHAIAGLVVDPAQRVHLGERALEFAREVAEPSRHAARVVSVYDEVLASTPRRTRVNAPSGRL